MKKSTSPIVVLAKKPRRKPNHQELEWIDNATLDGVIEQFKNPHSGAEVEGFIKQVRQALINRMMQGEMTHHLGYRADEAPLPESDNRRNGSRSKTVKTELGTMEVAIPRDRNGAFEPHLIPKHTRSFDGFNDAILSLYARGMSTRDITAHVEEIYGVNISPDLVSRVTDEVADEIKQWQNRPLDGMYPIVYVDALRVNIRDTSAVVNKSLYVVVGMNVDGEKEVLGLWLQATEGAKFWLSIFNDLRQRGLKDILILCADGLTGMPDAVAASFPKTIFQTCIVHMIRASTRFVSYKDLKAICADMKTMYTATNLDAANHALDAFEAKWSEKCPHAVKGWRTRHAEWIPFLDFAPEIRRAIYTTNPIEGLNRILRKNLKTRGALPTDEAALKLAYLSIRFAAKNWGKKYRDWNVASAQFAIHFQERFTQV